MSETKKVKKEYKFFNVVLGDEDIQSDVAIIKESNIDLQRFLQNTIKRTAKQIRDGNFSIAQ
ncbi:MAG: hypothetical protein ACXV76_09880 [Halobacteriota archaeon]